jgi:hypothetical protein
MANGMLLNIHLKEIEDSITDHFMIDRIFEAGNYSVGEENFYILTGSLIIL